MVFPKLASMRIIAYPDPVLKKRCVPVETFDAQLRSLTDRMFDLMHDANGVGLAAPQVGVLLRLFICNVSGEPEDDCVVINPRFTELSGAEEAEEGCLSLPGVNVTMRRAVSTVMEAVDCDGKPFRATDEGLVARVWQHEADHLDGRLITDTMSATDEIANRRTMKTLEAEYKTRRRP